MINGQGEVSIVACESMVNCVCAGLSFDRVDDFWVIVEVQSIFFGNFDKT